MEQLKIPVARQRQLLHNEDFDWSNRMKYRLWMLRNRCIYLQKFRSYAAAIQSNCAG